MDRPQTAHETVDCKSL